MVDRLLGALRVICARGSRSAPILAAGLLLTACAAPLPPRPDIPYGQGLLWQVDKTGQEPSYVFGTMHVPDSDILATPEAVETAFARSEQAAFELVIEEKDQVEIIRRFATAALLPGDESLSDMLGDSAYHQLIRIARRQRPRVLMIGRTHISRFKPWYVMLVVGKNDTTASHLDPRDPSLDDWLEARAKADGKKVFALETFDEQLAVFDGMSLDDQVALLKAHLDNYNRWPSFGTAKHIYLTGDVALAMGIWQENLRNVDVGVAYRVTERFLDRRNRNMVERMLPLLTEASTFVAVGALHLPGETGILRLLEQEGYSVTRLH